MVTEEGGGRGGESEGGSTGDCVFPVRARGKTETHLGQPHWGKHTPPSLLHSLLTSPPCGKRRERASHRPGGGIWNGSWPSVPPCVAWIAGRRPSGRTVRFPLPYRLPSLPLNRLRSLPLGSCPCATWPSGEDCGREECGEECGVWSADWAMEGSGKRF